MTETEILKKKLDLAMKYLTAIEYSASVDAYTTGSREAAMRKIERQAQVAKQ